MRVMVLRRNGVGLRPHYITGYHGPVASVWKAFIFIPYMDFFLCYSVISVTQ